MPVTRIPGKKPVFPANQQLSVGWFPSAVYEDGTPVALVAAAQEYTERSFMRTTVVEQTQAWNEKLAVLLRQSPEPLTGLGAVVQGDIQEKIASITTPPLLPDTLAARKRRGNNSEKPLVDTRYLFNTLTYVVDAI